MTPRVINLIAGGAILGLSALFYAQTLGDRFADTPLSRNPMAFPRLLVLLMALGGAVVIAQALLTRRGALPGEAVPALNWPRAALITALAAAYFWVFEPFGFLIATGLFLPLAVVALGYRRLLVIVPVTLVVLVGLWYLFAQVFQIRPPGPGMDDLLRLMTGGR
ncbi:MAG: Tripartite tricarboxylate transporter TctB family [Rhodobacteraceae bacterium HLUCCA12]|nr:MAG: Tripartite tricarboxylate transporter TctB family [Rhodobacteraceae bacterium HLUCCA12]